MSPVVLEGLPCFANTNALREGIQTTYQSIKVFVIYIISRLTTQFPLRNCLLNSMGEGEEWFQSEETAVHSDGLQKEGLGGKEY